MYEKRAEDTQDHEERKMLLERRKVQRSRNQVSCRLLINQSSSMPITQSSIIIIQNN